MSGLAILAIVVLVILLLAGGGLVVWGSRRADNWVAYLGLGIVLVVGFLLCMIAFPPTMAASIQASLGVKNAPIAETVVADDEPEGVVLRKDKAGMSLQVTLKTSKRLLVAKDRHGTGLIGLKHGTHPVSEVFEGPPPAEIFLYRYDARGNPTSVHQVPIEK